MPNFDKITYQDANPMQMGLQQALQGMSQFNQLRYQPQTLAAQLLQTQLANQKAQALLPYVAPQAAAELKYTQAQTPYLNAETQNQLLAAQKARALLPFAAQEAQANLDQTRMQTRMMPLDALIKAQQAAQQGSRFGAAYQMANALKAMAPAARDTWIANNQAEYSQMISDLGNSQNANFITPDIISKYIPGFNPQSGSAPSQQIQAPQQQNGSMLNNIFNALQPQQNNTQNPNDQLRPLGMPRFGAPTPEQIEQTRLANQIAANNSLTTAATRRQLEGALQVEGIFNDPTFQSQAQNAANYAGAMGKGSAALAALSQNNPKAYEDYLSFKNQTMPLILNRIKTLDQMGATDKQREDLENLYKKTADSLTSNPEQFITQLNNLGSMLNTISQQVQKSATPIANINRLSGFNPIQQQSANPLNQADLEFTARKYGMTVDQVKQKLGVR